MRMRTDVRTPIMSPDRFCKGPRPKKKKGFVSFQNGTLKGFEAIDVGSAYEAARVILKIPKLTQFDLPNRGVTKITFAGEIIFPHKPGEGKKKPRKLHGKGKRERVLVCAIR